MRVAHPTTGFLIHDVARLLRRNFNDRAQDCGLSQAQWQALAYLALEEGVKQVTLAEKLEVTPITLARLIDKLEDAGLVVRRHDPEDRRAFRLYLTPGAAPLLDRLWATAAAVREEAMSGLTADERETLLAILRKMKSNLLAAEGSADEPVTESVESDA